MRLHRLSNGPRGSGSFSLHTPIKRVLVWNLAPIFSPAILLSADSRPCRRRTRRRGGVFSVWPYLLTPSWLTSTASSELCCCFSLSQVCFLDLVGLAAQKLREMFWNFFLVYFNLVIRGRTSKFWLLELWNVLCLFLEFSELQRTLILSGFFFSFVFSSADFYRLVGWNSVS